MSSLEKLLTVLLSNEVVLGYILAIMGAVYAWLKKKAEIKNERINRGLLFVEQGCYEVAKEVGIEMKKAAKDGKFTEEEKRNLREVAKSKAISYAKKEGWDLLTYIAESTIPMLIKKIVDGNKPGKND